MSQARQAPLQSTEDLRTLYRALGVSEETLARAIQFSEAPTTPELPKIKQRRGRPLQNVRRLGQSQPAGRLPAASVKRGAARQSQA
jgi:hypothetical protein